jgi:hypothetical protein
MVPPCAWPSSWATWKALRRAVSYVPRGLREAVDYWLDMALRWAAIHQVAAVAAFVCWPVAAHADREDIAERVTRRWSRSPADRADLAATALIRGPAPGRPGPGRAEQGLPPCWRPRSPADLTRCGPGQSGARRAGWLPPRGARQRARRTGPHGRRRRGYLVSVRADGEVSAPVVGTQLLGHFTARTRTATWPSPPAWCCIPRRPRFTCSTSPPGPGSCRSGPAASCSPRC